MMQYPITLHILAFAGFYHSSMSSGTLVGRGFPNLSRKILSEGQGRHKDGISPRCHQIAIVKERGWSVPTLSNLVGKADAQRERQAHK